MKEPDDVPRLVVAVLVSLLAALTLSSCGQGSSAPEQPRRSFNQADVEFAVAMQSHHQQALTMAEMAESRAVSPEVKQLADEIAAAQGPEIDRMAAWLRRWGKHGGKLPGHGEEPHAEGMVSEHDMARLEQVSGEEFDRRWLRLVIDHHEGAVEMARHHRHEGRHPGAQAMAADVVRTQKQEIRTMKDLLAEQ